MARIAVIVANPRPTSFSEALADAYARGAEAAGHTAAVHRLRELTFDPILRGAFAEPQPREPDLDALHQAIMEADHLVLVFPLWFGSMPALLKGMIDRIFQPEAVEPMRRGELIKPLRGKSARLVITMSMPAPVYRLVFGAPVVKILKNHILGFLGARPVRATMFGMMEKSSEPKRKSWIARIETLGRQAR